MVLDKCRFWRNQDDRIRRPQLALGLLLLRRVSTAVGGGGLRNAQGRHLLRGMRGSPSLEGLGWVRRG